ncbi:MAG: isochorismatase family protein [Ignavibacteria bacterium]|nr:isochorismatase family protein [Ignavibacteria bacterium]HCN36257.1 isochorismatase [Bacteroidota bacterium]
MNNRIALLNIDMQKIYLKDVAEQKDITEVCEYINYTADILRNKNQEVIHIKDIENLTEEDKNEYEIIPEIKIREGEKIITKIYGNSFWETELESYLKTKNINFLILSGFAAENCVLFTYNGAIERKFTPVILQNGILSSKKDNVFSTYRDRQIISYSAVNFICDLLN